MFFYLSDLDGWVVGDSGTIPVPSTAVGPPDEWRIRLRNSQCHGFSARIIHPF